LEQGRWDFRGGGSYQYFIERGFFGKAERAIANIKFHMVPKMLNDRFSLLTKLGNALYRIQFGSYGRQYTCLVPGTGADFQDLVAGLYIQKLGLVNNGIRLRYGLPLADRKRFILVCLLCKGRIKKKMSRNIFNSLQKPLIKASLTAKLFGKALSHAFVFVLVYEPVIGLVVH